MDDVDHGALVALDQFPERLVVAVLDAQHEDDVGVTGSHRWQA